ncbi:pilus assembly protein Flp/PilA [Streptomyces sp. Amel2xB2]|uniref:Uncharacterized protein n=1 Tax=Streptomyces nanshensis TaxID=518642 RepID=A0A1E7L146_9ACTN|nr:MULTISPECIES: hypothetical protein [Streptomyces]OEV09900.1 hypothetical protein AN218_20025 [Streptomyces nanshensis]RAJ71621.1 pilus assembly protein Flp/PilA [Streptomyces sp. Amel2xB2]
MSKAVRRWRHSVTERLHGRWSDRGASAIEYAGIVIIVAAIILAIRGLGLNTAISGAIAKAVNSVLGN